MLKFQLQEDSQGRTTVNIFDETGQTLLGVIYPYRNSGIHVVSRYLPNEPLTAVWQGEGAIPTPSLVIDLVKGVINVTGNSPVPGVRLLSNFAATPFRMEGVNFASVEGFIQGIKYPPGHAKRTAAFAAVGAVAKKLGKDATKMHVWWNGEEIIYRSASHIELIARAMRAKFAQNEAARVALIGTRGYTFTHHTGTPEAPDTSLPATVFCEILRQIRESLLKADSSS